MEYLAWPGAVLIIVVAAMFIFRPQFAALIPRLKKLPGGIETSDLPALPQPVEAQALHQFLREYDSPLLLEVERSVREEMQTRGLDDPAHREVALIRSLAGVQILAYFDRLNFNMWGSQLNCLRYLNGRDLTTDADIRWFYTNAIERFPAWYANVEFETWLDFLTSTTLIFRANEGWQITVRGREYLKHRITTATPDPAHN